MSDEQARDQLLSCLEDVQDQLEDLHEVTSAVVVSQAMTEIKALSSRLDAAEKAIVRTAEIGMAEQKRLVEANFALERRLDSLSAAVRKAWDAHREGDMWKALGGAMDIVDPERNEQPIRAVEIPASNSDTIKP